jgi:hypothetical protein
VEDILAPDISRPATAGPAAFGNRWESLAFEKAWERHLELIGLRKATRRWKKERFTSLTRTEPGFSFAFSGKSRKGPPLEETMTLHEIPGTAMNFAMAQAAGPSVVKHHD